MSERSRPPDPGNVWRNQPRETLEMNLQQLVNRRTQDIYARTRMELLTSLFAALFLLVVIALRFPVAENLVLQLCLAAIVAWLGITLYRFRDRILRPRHPTDFAISGLDHYRNELTARRDQLRDGWLTNGPVALATILLAVFILQRALPNPALLMKASPFFTLLVVSIVWGVVRRKRMIRDIQREIDEIDEAK